MPRYLALDVGGTKVEAGVVTADGQVLASNLVPSHAGGTRDQLLADIRAALEPYADEDVVGLGAGFPSFGDYERGILDSELSGFPSMHGFALRQYLEDEYGVPARLVADPNLLAFGILRFGEGREHPTFGAIGLGTGTAIGIVRGGQVLTGPKGFPDPVMRFYTVWGWPPAWGHSGFHFADHYGADAKTVAGRALAGNDDAFVTWNSVGAALAKTLVRLASDADVDLFVIAGGLANAYELFEPSLKSGTSDHGITVMKTALNKPALLGAAALFMD